MTRRLALALAFFASACARTSDEPAASPTSACGDNPTIAGICVGVLPTAVCDQDRCGDPSCKRTVPIDDDAALQRATPVAVAGDCLALAPGTYGAVEIPGGVSVLGRAASVVTVASVHVSFTSGESSILRGIAVKKHGVRANGRGSLTLDRVLVEETDDLGVQGEETDVSLVQSTIASPKGAGVLVACRTTCPPGARPKLSLARTWIHDAHEIGAWAFGIDATVRETVIDATHAAGFVYGRGMEVSNGATIQASRLRVEKSDDVGILVHGSAGSLGPEIEVRSSMRGIWLGAIPDGGVTVDGFTIEGTSAVSLGIDKGSLGVVVRNGSIRATQLLAVPVDVGGVQKVADGISWGAGAQASIDSTVHIAASERLPAVIDATARGTFAPLLEEGDDAKGIVIQHGMSHPDLTVAPGIKVGYGDPGAAGGTSSAPKP